MLRPGPDFIRSAVQSKTSKATYLHGSFGSGKSHFMAVLHLILQGNPTARGIPELAGSSPSTTTGSPARSSCWCRTT